MASLYLLMISFGLHRNLWRNFPEDKMSDFTYLDCLWFSLYTEESYRGDVLSWIKNKHIFSKKYVFVPIVLWLVFLLSYLQTLNLYHFWLLWVIQFEMQYYQESLESTDHLQLWWKFAIGTYNFMHVVTRFTSNG